MIDAAERVARLLLKPMQKLYLLTKHVMPGFYHLLVTDPPSQNKIKEVDRSIRGVVKRIMHLPSSTTDALIYSRRLDGGLGIPRLKNLVKVGSIKAKNDLLLTEDPVI